MNLNMTPEEKATQKRIDWFFDVVTKAGFTVFFAGIIVGLALGIERGFPVIIGGGLLLITGFWVDIMFSPRWKRK